MANVYPIKSSDLNVMMNEFHRQYDIAQTSEKRAHSARLKCALLLKDMREECERQGLDWWPWFEANSVRSREDAEELLRIAYADDPEEAYEEEKRKTREKVSRLRTREKEFPLEALKRKIGKLEDEQRHELSAWFRSEYGL